MDTVLDYLSVKNRSLLSFSTIDGSLGEYAMAHCIHLYPYTRWSFSTLQSTSQPCHSSVYQRSQCMKYSDAEWLFVDGMLVQSMGVSKSWCWILWTSLPLGAHELDHVSENVSSLTKKLYVYTMHTHGSNWIRKWLYIVHVCLTE